MLVINLSCAYRLEVVIKLLKEKFVSAEERAIATKIEKEGGLEKVQKDDETLRALIGLDKSPRPQVEDSLRGILPQKTARNKISPLDQLKADLLEDVDLALKKNFDVFMVKFEIQAEYIKAESDRDRKSTRLNSSHSGESRMPSSA